MPRLVGRSQLEAMLVSILKKLGPATDVSGGWDFRASLCSLAAAGFAARPPILPCQKPQLELGRHMAMTTTDSDVA